MSENIENRRRRAVEPERSTRIDLSDDTLTATQLGERLSGSRGQSIVLSSGPMQKTREPIVVRGAEDLTIVASGPGPHVESLVDGEFRKNREDGERLCGPADLAFAFEDCRAVRLVGLHLAVGAGRRYSCGRDSALAFRACSIVDVLGCTIDGASSCGMLFYRGCRDVRVAGNRVCNTMADGIHVTGGTRQVVVVDNLVDNRAVRGDDGIACVSYANDPEPSADMTVARNIVLGGTHGRGIAVDGGETVRIVDNTVVGSNGAGILLSGESSYRTQGCRDCSVIRNRLFAAVRGRAQNRHDPVLLSGRVSDCRVLANFSCLPERDWTRFHREEGSASGNLVSGNVHRTLSGLRYDVYAAALARTHGLVAMQPSSHRTDRNH